MVVTDGSRMASSWRTLVPTWVAGCVWLTVLGNYIHLTCLRAEPLPTSALALGYALVILQIASFLLCQLTEPGSPPAEWIAAVKRGGSDAPSFVPHHDVADVFLPPRARYVRRSKTVILHFDHHCRCHKASTFGQPIFKAHAFCHAF